MRETKIISKAELSEVRFKNTPGHFSTEELRASQSKLHLSILLPDYAESIVKIVFNTVDGYKEVKTSIWGATEKYILLTGGNFIPVEAVASVSLD